MKKTIPLRAFIPSKMLNNMLPLAGHQTKTSWNLVVEGFRLTITMRQHLRTHGHHHSKVYCTHNFFLACNKNYGGQARQMEQFFLGCNKKCQSFTPSGWHSLKHTSSMSSSLQQIPN